MDMLNLWIRLLLVEGDHVRSNCLESVFSVSTVLIDIVDHTIIPMASLYFFTIRQRGALA